MSNRKSIEQARMTTTFGLAEGKSYKAQVNKLPSLILLNGVGNAIAFIYSKSEWKNLRDDLKTYLIAFGYDDKPTNELVIELNDLKLKALQSEILAFCKWMKRFVKK